MSFADSTTKEGLASSVIMSAVDVFIPRERRISRFAAMLRACLDDTISLDTTRQVEVLGRPTPVLKNGSAILNLDCSIPDRFTAQTGVTATIFVKCGDDFVRISTSIKKQNGERAIGTALNRAHPGYSRLTSGQPYVGYATLFGTQYLTQYDTIKDVQGRVIGALYVGIDVSKHRQMHIATKLSLLAFLLAAGSFSTALWLFGGSMSPHAIGLVAAAILSGVLYQVMNRTVTTPLRDARDAAKRLAAGDLTAQVHVDRADEIGELMQAVNGVSQGLSDIVGNVRDGSNRITAASQEIATGNSDLSSRTSAQAAALEETASSMEQLTAAVRQNSDNAQQANQLVQSASTHAARGGEVISRVVETMGAIKTSSRQVTQFVNEIEDIAFQTNILALNAAVEAARAGAQGRSFTVVAGDVRNLAQRCDVAAKQIKTLTSDAEGQVDAGSTLAEQARRTTDEMVAAVKRVVSIMNEISSASQEQGKGIEQVNDAIGQMDEMTQQNAALVEQAAASAESLHSQAEELSKAVATFKLR
jgi:methyl-accepting chemotaxis protein